MISTARKKDVRLFRPLLLEGERSLEHLIFISFEKCFIATCSLLLVHLFQPWLDDQWCLKYFDCYVTSFLPQSSHTDFHLAALDWMSSWLRGTGFISKAHLTTCFLKTHFFHLFWDLIPSFIFPLPCDFNFPLCSFISAVRPTQAFPSQNNPSLI